MIQLYSSHTAIQLQRLWSSKAMDFVLNSCQTCQIQSKYGHLKILKENVCRFSLHSRLFLDVCLQVELNNRQTVSLEIAKALEETRQQKEELQTQVSGRTCHTSFNIHKYKGNSWHVLHTHIHFLCLCASNSGGWRHYAFGLSVCPSVRPSHCCEHDILRTPWDHFVKYGTNVHCDSRMNNNYNNFILTLKDYERQCKINSELGVILCESKSVYCV